jgi:hypothetical protein
MKGFRVLAVPCEVKNFTVNDRKQGLKVSYLMSKTDSKVVSVGITGMPVNRREACYYIDLGRQWN